MNKHQRDFPDRNRLQIDFLAEAVPTPVSLPIPVAIRQRLPGADRITEYGRTIVYNRFCAEMLCDP